MKAPNFWFHNSIKSKLLNPLGFLYNLLGQIRIKLVKPYKAPIKVICVGNLTVGGVGKTPICIALSELLSKGINNIFFLTRGYKGKLKNTATTTAHNAEAVGDEAVLLSRHAPTVVNPNRAAGAKYAVQNGAELIIMDDGFQNPYLYKDFSFIVVDSSQGFGNGKVLPAGCLRENIKTGMKRANAIILIGDDKRNLTQELKKYNLPVIKAKLVLDKTSTNALISKKIVAFAGIGIPQKFFNSLIDVNLNLIKTVSFPDHYQYKTKDLENLIEQAKENNAVLVTTEKDYVKIPNEFKNNIIPIPVKIAWEDEQKVISTLGALF